MIDRANPFVLNLNSAAALHEAAFLVQLTYSDLRGREHSTSHLVDALDPRGPVIY